MKRKLICIAIISIFLGTILLPSITAEQIESKPHGQNYFITNQSSPSKFKLFTPFNLTFHTDVYWISIYSGFTPRKFRFLGIVPSDESNGPIANLTYEISGEEHTIVFEKRLIVSISISEDTYQNNLTSAQSYYDPDGGYVSGFAFRLFYLGR